MNHLRTCIVGALMPALLFLGGCSGIHQAREVTPTGFLGDYSQLSPGENEQALLTYTNPRTNFSQYSQIMLDPIRVYPGQGDSELASLPPDDLLKLVNYFDATLRETLSEQFVFTNAAGPNTMRMRVAITEGESANVPIDLVSSVMPIGLALSSLKRLATGSAAAVGSIGVEFEALDAWTGERLAASVDKQVGDKFTGKFDKFNEWRTAQEAFDHWAEQLNDRLLVLRRNGNPSIP